MTENNWLTYLSDPSQTLADSMTESEWLACDDPLALQLLIPRLKISDRRVRLFACACCRRIWEFFTDGRCRAAVEVAERYADGIATAAELQQAREIVYEAADAVAAACAVGAVIDLDGCMAHGVAQSAASCIADATGLDYLNESEAEAWEKAVETANQELMALFRDIAGNPFRSITIDTSWRTRSVANLAQTIYADRAFDRLPILADALEDAGCTDAAILEHCRGPGPHVRGCWVVDLLLGKM